VPDQPLGEFRPLEQSTVVRLFVPAGEPIEYELDIHPHDFKKAYDAEAPNGLVIAEDREGKRWFCAYASVHSFDTQG
jgi:hypothetical protein